MYKTRVEKIDMDSCEIVNDKEYWYILDEYYKSLNGFFVRVKLVNYVDDNMRSLDYLKENGFKAAPQGPMRVKDELTRYLDKFFSI